MGDPDTWELFEAWLRANISREPSFVVSGDIVLVSLQDHSVNRIVERQADTLEGAMILALYTWENGNGDYYESTGSEMPF